MKLKYTFSICLLLVACSTKTTIRTEPSNLEVLIDGRPVGTSPLAVDLSNLISEKHRLTLKNEGKVVKDMEMEKTIKWIPLFLSPFGSGFPLLWSFGPREDQYVIVQDPPAQPTSTNNGTSK